MIKKTVLVVDDEPRVRKMFSRFLLKAGYDVLEADRGKKALELLAQNEIDVVLLDILMPGMSGDECLAKINKDFKNVPVVMVTAVTNISTGIDVMKKGAFDYIVKPVERARFLTVVERAIEKRDSIEEVKPFNVHEVFLLTSDGIVMFHKSYIPKNLYDEDIFGGMLTAVKTLIQDMLASEDSKEGLKEIKKGSFKLLVEDGNNFYLTIIGEGDDITKIRDEMNEAVETINDIYSVILSKWKGNMNKFDGLEQDLEKFFLKTFPYEKIEHGIQDDLKKVDQQ